MIEVSHILLLPEGFKVGEEDFISNLEFSMNHLSDNCWTTQMDCCPPAFRDLCSHQLTPHSQESLIEHYWIFFSDSVICCAKFLSLNVTKGSKPVSDMV